MDIKDIRDKFPMYGDMSDTELVDAIKKKYYPDMPDEQYYAKVGVPAPSLATDVPKSAVSGLARGTIEDIGGFPGAMADLLNKYVVDPATSYITDKLGVENNNPESSDFMTPEYINRKAGINYYKPRTTTGKYTEAIMENVPAFAVPEEGLLSVASRRGGQAARGLNLLKSHAGTRAAGAVLSGTGEEAAGELTDDNPLARAAGGLVGGATAGLTGLRGAVKERRAMLAAKDLPEEAQKYYKILDQSTVPVDELNLQMAGAAIDASLRKDGFRPIQGSAPGTFRLLRDEMMLRKGGYSTSQTRRTVGDLVNLHAALGKINPVRDPADYDAAQMARHNIAEFLDQQSAGLGEIHKKAIKTWRAGAKVEEINDALRVAQDRAKSTGTGMNKQNTMMQEVRRILDSKKNIKGYSPAAIEQMQKVVSGTLLSNFSRYAGRFAPTGLHSSALALAGVLVTAKLTVPFVIGGFAFKKLGEVLTREQIEKLLDILREEAPVNIRPKGLGRTVLQKGERAALAAPIRGAAIGYESGEGRSPEAQPVRQPGEKRTDIIEDLGNFASGGLYGVAKGRGYAGTPALDNAAAIAQNLDQGAIWTGGQFQTAAKLLREGKSYKQIGEALGKSEKAVQGFIARNMPELRPEQGHGVAWDPQRVEDLRELAPHVHPEEAAKFLGFSRKAILSAADRHGISFGGAKPLTAAEHAMVQRLRQQGLSPGAIAKQINRSRNAVKSSMDRHQTVQDVLDDPSGTPVK